MCKARLSEGRIARPSAPPFSGGGAGRCGRTVRGGRRRGAGFPRKNKSEGFAREGLEVSVSAMLVSIHQKNIAQAFILERYFFVSIYPAVIPGTYLMVFLVVALLLCLLHQIYIQRS